MRLLTDLGESPLLNPTLPPEDLRSRIRQIRSGFEPLAAQGATALAARGTLPGARPRPRPRVAWRARAIANGSTTTRPFSTRHMPATNPSTRNVCATSPFTPITFFRYCLREHAGPVRPSEQRVVPLREEANGRGSLRIRQWSARGTSRSSRPLLVAEAAQRLEPVERPLDLRHVHHRPGDDVAARGGPERREVATEDLGARLRRVMRLGLLDRDEASLRTPVPERRLVMVQQVGAHTRRTPGAARFDAGEPVLALEERERLGRGDGCPTPRALAPMARAASRPTSPTGVRLALRCAYQRIVASRHEMQRLPHRRRLDDRRSSQLALERLAPKARRARPDADVRRRRPLRLHADEAFDHRRRRQPFSLEQELAGERRAVQLAQREDSLGHAQAATSGCLIVPGAGGNGSPRTRRRRAHRARRGRAPQAPGREGDRDRASNRTAPIVRRRKTRRVVRKRNAMCPTDTARHHRRARLRAPFRDRHRHGSPSS